jgi:hypothetical protein
MVQHRTDEELVNLALIEAVYRDVLGPLDPDQVDRYFVLITSSIA